MSVVPALTRREALRFAGFISLLAYGTWRVPGLANTGAPRGYGTDPNLLERPVTWPRTLSAVQLATLEALCDLILPAEPPHRSAAQMQVHHFLDEWVSAPYPTMQTDRGLILAGLQQLEWAAHAQFRRTFADLSPLERAQAFDSVWTPGDGQEFTRRLIELVCAGYYTSREGHAAIGYIGNVPRAEFPGTPAEILLHFEELLAALPPLPPTMSIGQSTAGA